MARSTIFNYLDKYNRISLAEEPLNELDILIFSRIAYFPFEKFINNSNYSLSKLASAAKKAKINQKDFFWADDYKLFNYILRSKRFSNLKLTNFKSVLDQPSETQFAAIVIKFKYQSFISFRGTDDSLIGWKEDFNMAFSKTVPSQIIAKNFVNKIFWRNPLASLTLLGHSKGGNLAVYAAFSTNKLVQKRIKQVYNIDGPGFLDNIQTSPKYQLLRPKIRTIIPEGSIVGKLLNQTDYVAVKSYNLSILQHDIYSWQTDHNKLVRTESTSKHSDKIDQALTHWLASMSLQQRAKIVELIHGIVSSTKVNSIKELSAKLPQSIAIMIKSYANLKTKDKKTLEEANKRLLKILFLGPKNDNNN